MSNTSLPLSCICDSYSPSTDCCGSHCTPFFSVFFVLEAVVLIILVSFFTTVEFITKKKSILWRLILSAGIISSLAKVLRLGMLVNPATRHESSLLLLFFLDTHQCFGIIAFLSLVFFWARLQHDLVANKGIYGKLLPVYIGTVIAALVLYYAQLPIEVAFHGKGALLQAFKILSGFIVLFSTAAYLVYGVLLWKTVKSKRDSHPLFYRIFISALVTAIFMLISCLVLFATRIVDSDSCYGYLWRHSIYEVCYFAQLAAMPSGFIVHFFKSNSHKKGSRARSISHPTAAGAKEEGGIVLEQQSKENTSTTM